MPHILMETDIMVRPEQLVNRLLFCFVFVFFSCEEPKKPFSLDSSKIDLAKSVVLYQGVPYSGKVYRFYPGGLDTLWVQNYKGGLKNGVWKKYFLNGEVKEERRFRNGKKEGDYVGYYSGGNKNFIFKFQNGEYNGTNKVWTKEGLLIEEGNFKNGYEHGVQKTWYLNGKIKSNYIIKNNRRYGLLGTKNCVNIYKGQPKV